MRKLFMVAICFLCLKTVHSQIKKRASLQSTFTNSQKYISFNPLALAEPQMVVGAGFGNRFTERSEYFAELSYVLKQPFYNAQPENERVNGYRLITQYRYHFLQKPQSNVIGRRKSNKRNNRHEPFLAFEFKIKSFNYNSERVLANKTTLDTLQKMNYQTNNFNIGAALLYGETYNISEHFKIELTIGIGGRDKTIKYKNAKPGYEEIGRMPDSYSPLNIDKPGGMPYFAVALRLKYLLQ